MWSRVTKLFAPSLLKKLSALDPASPPTGGMAPARTKPENDAQASMFCVLCAMEDSNLRPSPRQGDALPTELTAHSIFFPKRRAARSPYRASTSWLSINKHTLFANQTGYTLFYFKLLLCSNCFYMHSRERPKALETSPVYFPQIVGGTTRVEKNRINRFFSDIVEKRSQEDLALVEEARKEALPTPRYLVEALRAANQITNPILKKNGVPLVKTPIDRVFLVPDSYFSQFEHSGGDTEALVDYKKNLVFINASMPGGPIAQSLALLHEIFHLKAFKSVLVDETDKDGFTFYRMGHKILQHKEGVAQNSSGVLFVGLDEATTTFLQSKYKSIFLKSIPSLKEEIAEQNNTQNKRLQKKIAEELGVPAEDVFWVNKDTREFASMRYAAQRKTVSYVVKTIVEDNPRVFLSSENVYKLLESWYFSGNLAQLGRLVEGSFGRGGFRTFAGMGEDANTSNLVLQVLEKNRSVVLKDRDREREARGWVL